MPAAADPDPAGWFAALMARLGPFRADRAVGVAVSGGADSLALAWLAAGWGRPLGLVVDHGLRRGSAAEASLTARRLADFGVPARILTLDLPAASTAAAARRARYDALAAACADAGLPQLLLGHHAGDQAETLLLRALHGSAAAGRAGMAAIQRHGDIALLRPLLGTPRAALLALLRARAIGWVEDPSNTNLAAERARLRVAIGEPDGLGPRTAHLCAAAAGWAERRMQTEQEVARWLAGHAMLHPALFARLPDGPWPAPALSALLRWAGAAPYPPPAAGVATLAAAPRPATIGGARLLRWRDGWVVAREAAAMAPPVPARAGAVWDGRFRLAAGLPAGLLSLGGCGDAVSRARAHPPAAVVAVMPALRWADGSVSVPHLGVGPPAPALFACPPNPAAGNFVATGHGGDAPRAKNAYVSV